MHALLVIGVLQAYDLSVYPNASMDLDVLVDAWRGTLKMSLLSAFKSSHDEHITITRAPLQGVHVNKAFKVHGLQLAALTGNVAVTCDRPSHASSIPIGTVFSKDGVDYIGYLKPMLKFPPKVVRAGCAQKGVEPYLVGYWAVRSSYASADVNAEQVHKDIQVKVGVLSTTVRVPVITNTKPLAIGDEVIVLKAAQSDYTCEPPSKTPRVEGRQKGSGKAKGKASSGKGKR